MTRVLSLAFATTLGIVSLGGTSALGADESGPTSLASGWWPPEQTSPVANEFVMAATATKLSNGEKGVTFEASMTVNNAKGRKLIFVALLIDETGKPIPDETEKSVLIPHAINPEADQWDAAVKFQVPRAALETLCGVNAKEFPLEMSVVDVTDVKDMNDRTERAKNAKVIGSAPVVVNIAIPTANATWTAPMPRVALRD